LIVGAWKLNRIANQGKKIVSKDRQTLTTTRGGDSLLVDHVERPTEH
jgi:hypothetical protein